MKKLISAFIIGFSICGMVNSMIVNPVVASKNRFLRVPSNVSKFEGLRVPGTGLCHQLLLN
jgi:hypothetical protein